MTSAVVATRATIERQIALDEYFLSLLHHKITKLQNLARSAGSDKVTRTIHLRNIQSCMKQTVRVRDRQANLSIIKTQYDVLIENTDSLISLSTINKQLQSANINKMLAKAQESIAQIQQNLSHTTALSEETSRSVDPHTDTSVDMDDLDALWQSFATETPPVPQPLPAQHQQLTSHPIPQLVRHAPPNPYSISST